MGIGLKEEYERECKIVFIEMFVWKLVWELKLVSKDYIKIKGWKVESVWERKREKNVSVWERKERVLQYPPIYWVFINLYLMGSTIPISSKQT